MRIIIIKILFICLMFCIVVEQGCVQDGFSGGKSYEIKFDDYEKVDTIPDTTRIGNNYIIQPVIKQSITIADTVVSF